VNILKISCVFIFLLIIYNCNEIFCQQREKLYIRIHPTVKEDIQKLDDLDLDYAYKGLKKHADAFVSQPQLEIIRNRGFEIEYLQSLNKANLYDAGYHTYEEMVAELDSLSQLFPNITEVFQIGVSQQTQIPIYAIKISDNAHLDENEFTINYDGMHHAREPMGLETCLLLVNHLLNNYGVDPQIREIVDNCEIWVTPILNTEGYKYLVDNDLRSPWWRKNQRDNNNNGQFDPDFDGVDLNRNYDYKFGVGGSGDISSWTYRGSFPFSESEIQAKRDLALRERFLCSITYHSYAEEIYYYRGVNGNTIPETPIIDTIVDSMANRIPNWSRTGYYEPGGSTSSTNMSYPWMFVVAGTYEYLIELGTGPHIPEYSVAHKIAQDNLKGAMFLLEKTIAGPGIKGNVVDAVTGAPIEANIKIEEYFRDGLTPRKSEVGFGRFHRFAEPGSYTLEVVATGYAPKTIQNVVVNVGNWTDVQIALDYGGTPVVNSYFVDDDTIGVSVGNSDGFANINEKIELQIELKNIGRADLADISAKLISLSSLATIIDGDKDFGNIPIDSVAISTGKFAIEVDYRCADGYELPFNLEISNNNIVFWKEEISVPVRAPVLDYQYVIVHDSLGNNNGALEPGETADLEIVLANNGHMDASVIHSIFSPIGGNFDYFDRRDTCDVLKIGQHNSVVFTVKLSESAPDPYIAQLKLSVVSMEKYYRSQTFLLVCVAGFFDNMEFGENSWWSEFRNNPSNTHNDWQYGAPFGDAGGQDPSSTYSGKNCWANDLGGEGWNGYYQHNVDIYLHSPVINCGLYSDVGLKFMRWLNIRNGDLAEVLVNDQPVWDNNNLAIYDKKWTNQVLNIANIADGNDSVVVSFRLKSNGSSYAGGWTIDDVLVKDQLVTLVPSSENERNPQKFELFQNYPNPFNSETTLNYNLPENGNVKIRIFNIIGQEINRLVDQKQKSGSYTIVWNGKDYLKRDVSSGIYFVKFDVTTEKKDFNHNQIKKIMLVR
jgi:hypothetical protein